MPFSSTGATIVTFIRAAGLVSLTTVEPQNCVGLSYQPPAWFWVAMSLSEEYPRHLRAGIGRGQGLRLRPPMMAAFLSVSINSEKVKQTSVNRAITTTTRTSTKPRRGGRLQIANCGLQIADFIRLGDS